jgi:hypothetical protein
VSAWRSAGEVAAAIVLLHVAGYLAAGIVLVVAGRRRRERLRTWLARRVPAAKRG